MENIIYEKLLSQYGKIIHKCIRDMNLPQNIVEDAIQEGEIALWLASQLYDNAKGASFSTYAYSSIRNYISKYLARNTLVRKPRSFFKNRAKVFDLVNSHGMSFNDAVDQIFKDKSNIAKQSFYRLCNDICNVDEYYELKCASHIDLETHDCQMALSRLKQENELAWQVIDRYYIKNEQRKDIIASMKITTYQYNSLHQLGLKILKEILT